MDRLEKTKALNVKRADPVADIDLINQYSVKTLTPEEVYCFTVRLCDNEVDRDSERFTDATLGGLAPMFLGRSGLFDHRWSAEKQTARIYRTEVVGTGEQTKTGEPMKALVASAYMIRNEDTQATIDAIDGGILKEVSVGCSVAKCSCSICGEPQTLDWRTWTYQCSKGHIRGETYDGKLCVGNLEDPQEAYEFSFVAVPAQREAGVIKSAASKISVDHAFKALADADLTGQEDKIKALLPRLRGALQSAEEREKRARILAENRNYLKK